ncbi:hypothetical protein Y032_0541g3176 [Ancylostoma ceylanicum]|uniref:Uncharacterized protein n=1 Tax=Ancylostoma ceylanicum TaxID=53326 RepID=A0A016WSZ8_9BILA|nr:hypothetical protein Y032_0541g3176 [Ancylostoma ceylanicum]
MQITPLINCVRTFSLHPLNITFLRLVFQHLCLHQKTSLLLSRHIVGTTILEIPFMICYQPVVAATRRHPAYPQGCIREVKLTDFPARICCQKLSLECYSTTLIMCCIRLLQNRCRIFGPRILE